MLSIHSVQLMPPNNVLALDVSRVRLDLVHAESTGLDVQHRGAVSVYKYGM